METVSILRRLQRAGNGGTPVSEKIEKITPEWQTEQQPSVDSAVARVKGSIMMVMYKVGWRTMPSNQVVPRTFSSCVDGKVFLI